MTESHGLIFRRDKNKHTHITPGEAGILGSHIGSQHCTITDPQIILHAR